MKKTYQFDNFTIEDKPMDYSGKLKNYQIVKRAKCVIIIPRYNSSFILVDEFRPALERNILQFPAGRIENNESPIEAAKRELKEETGFIADKLVEVGCFYSAPHFSDEFIYVFFAECTRSEKKSLTEREKLEIKIVESDKIDDTLCHSDAIDSKTITALFMWRTKKDEEL